MNFFIRSSSEIILMLIAKAAGLYGVKGEHCLITAPADSVVNFVYITAISNAIAGESPGKKFRVPGSGF
jgi:hypothetical protein